MRIIGQHTCSKEGGIERITRNAPFESTEYKTQKGEKKMPFLGRGYYLWDSNLEEARRWGMGRYGNSYIILEYELDCPGSVFLDLVGNRLDMKWFIDQMKLLVGGGVNRKENWNIAQFIEFLKRLSVHKPEVFPYKIIRAIDLYTKQSEQFRYFFVESRQSYTYLDPKIVVCLVEKNRLYLKYRRIVEQSED